MKQDLCNRAVSCSCRSNMILQHDRLKEKIISACSAAKLSPVCKQKKPVIKKNFFFGVVYLPCWSAGQPGALDVAIAITSPLQPNIGSNAARKSGFALRAAEDKKFEQYSQQCANRGVQFIPMAFESFRRLSDLKERH